MAAGIYQAPGSPGVPGLHRRDGHKSHRHRHDWSRLGSTAYLDERAEPLFRRVDRISSAADAQFDPLTVDDKHADVVCGA